MYNIDACTLHQTLKGLTTYSTHLLVGLELPIFSFSLFETF